MKHTHLFLCLLVTFLMCCSDDSTSNSNTSQVTSLSGPLKTINVEEAEEFDGYFNELVEDIYYVKLETSTEALFADISKLFVLGNRIIVFDENSKRVVVFDGEGNFLFKIYNLGEGPGEYKELESMAYNEVNGQFVLAASGKFLWFDRNGKFLKEVKTINAFADDIAVLPNNEIAAHYDMRGIHGYESKERMAILNESANILRRYQSLPDNVRMENITAFENHFTQSMRPLTIGVYSHDILRVSEDSVFIEYKLDFGSDAMPDDFIDIYITDPSYTSDMVRGIIAEKGYWSFYGSSGLQENKDYVLFLFTNRKSYYYGLYDKEKESVLKINTNLKESSGATTYLNFQSAYKDYFITKNGSKFIQNLYADMRGGTNRDELAEAIENEVPVLWFVKFKDVL